MHVPSSRAGDVASALIARYSSGSGRSLSTSPGIGVWSPSHAPLSPAASIIWARFAIAWPSSSAPPESTSGSHIPIRIGFLSQPWAFLGPLGAGEIGDERPDRRFPLKARQSPHRVVDGGGPPQSRGRAAELLLDGRALGVQVVERDDRVHAGG